MRVFLFVARRSYRARAFLKAARSLGIDLTVVTDHRSSLGDLAPEGTIAVRFEDSPRALSRILEFAERTPVHGVLSAEDDGVLLAARVAQALGLRHATPEAVEIVRDKARFRTAVQGAAWTVPHFVVVRPEQSAEEILDRVGFPCVVKPVSLSASRGVIRVDAPGDLASTLERVRGIAASSGVDPVVVVEDYLPGREVALEGLLTDGELASLAFLDKPDPMEGPYFEETILVTPSGLDPEHRSSVRAAVQSAADTVGLDQGPVHAEVRVDGEDVRVLELAPRSIGGRCSTVVRFAGDRSLEEILLDWAVGGRPDLERAPGARGVMMLPIPERGTLASVEGVGRATMVPGVEEIEITIPPGHLLEPLPEGHRYLGFLFARGSSPDEVVGSIRRAHGYLDVKMDESTTDTE